MSEASKSDGVRRGAVNVLRPERSIANLVPGVHVIAGQGKTLAIETARGVVLVDAGPGGGATAKMIAWLRERTTAPVTHIVCSHGHAGYNYGVAAWRAEAAERGHPPPVLVAQRGVRARYLRYIETAGLQQWLNSRQFRIPMPARGPEVYAMPDLEFDTQLSIDGGDRRIELISAPSETEDTIAVWLPAERFLYGSAAVICSIPNVGTPLRTMRDPVRWADTLEKLHALRPAVVVGEFGSPVTEAADIDALLLTPVAGLRWLREAVVARMNRGINVDDIVCELVDEGGLPESIFGHRFMRPIYGAPEYVIRDIWRSENGWWDRNPTSLHPAAPQAVAQDLREAIFGDAADAGDAGASGAADAEAATLLARVRSLAAEGRIQHALHVVDLLALLPAGAPGRDDARTLKAELLDARAAQVTTVVSRNLYRSEAEALRGQPLGSTRDQDPTGSFSWG